MSVTSITAMAIRLPVFLLLAQGLMAAAVTPPPNEACLVKAGKAQGQVYLPAKSGRPLLLAAEELRDYLHKMTGAEWPLAFCPPEARQGKGVGIQFRVRDRSEWEGKESSQSFIIQETDKPGKAAAIRGVTIVGNTEQAVLYGVYQYLHELGVRWFTPGEIGENVPRMSDIAIHNRRTVYTPSFVARSLDFSGRPADHFDISDPARPWAVSHEDYDRWLLRNRLMFQRSIHSGHGFDFNTIVGSGSHGLRVAALSGADFAKDPERFPMITIDGERKRREKGGQICFTHEKNIQQSIEKAVDFFAKQAATRHERNADLDDVVDTFPMGLSDADGICECDTCARIAGVGERSKDRLVWAFYNRVARAVRAQVPGAKIGLYAPYFELTRPPDDVRIETNIVAVSCRGISWSAAPEDQSSYPFVRRHWENMTATREAGAERRVYDYSTWEGTPQLLNILDVAEAYHSLGVRYYHVEVMNRNEQIWPILWTLARYTWDSSVKPEILLAEYCHAYYGAAGDVVLDLLKRMDASSRKIPRIIYGGLSDTQMIMSDELIAFGAKELAKALETVQGREKTRLERFRDTFAMFSRSADLYRRYCVALNRRTPETIAHYKAGFEDYEKFWETPNVRATCSPRVLMKVQGLGAVLPETRPLGRPELNDKTAWKKDLFAFDRVPETIPNLFALPELWKFKLDVTDRGLQEGWESTACDDRDGWQPVSTWNGFEPQGYPGINGRFWYRVTFKAPRFPDGKKVYLRIGSLDDEGDIYVNGELAHSRKMDQPGDWQSSFAFEVTAFLKQGHDNVIAVRGYDSFGQGASGAPAPCTPNDPEQEAVMYDLNKHPHFERWQDPVTGVVSFVLKERVAPIQQSFYFTNSSVSADERWLWFYAGFPPNRQQTLGCVSLDPANPEIKHYPQAGFAPAWPMVAPEGNAAYFCMANSVYRLSIDGAVTVVCTLPRDYVRYRHLGRLATHLTLSADGRYFLLDGELGNFWWVGLGDVETGAVKVLREFSIHHDHAQFSPTDPNLFLIPRDHWNDKVSGQRFYLDHRLWLMDINQTRYEPVRPKDWYDHNSNATHEWWSRDGLVCWVDYKKGTYECDPHTLETSHVWKREICHAHCSSDRQYWCGDENPYKWATQPVKLLFYDRRQGQEKAIVSAMPQPPVSKDLYRLEPPYCSRDLYHLDPHPHFSPRDSWVVYTTMVRGQVDVALCPTRSLIG